MTAQTPPGWYRDPYGTPGLQRYWDGNQWTQATQPDDEWEDAEPGPESTPDFVAPDQQSQTPPPFQAPQQPNWGWTGPAGVSSGPVTPQPWQAPYSGQQQPGRSNTGIVIALIAGGVVVLILIVLAGLFAGGVFDKKAGPTASPSGSSSPPVAGGAQSPVTGTLTDSSAGVSYAQLGGQWTIRDPTPTSGLRTVYGFTRGETAPVMQNYDNSGQAYLATIFSGRLPNSYTYNGTGDLQSANTAFAKALESEPEPNGSYPTHTREDLESKAYTVSGKSAWYTKFRLSFPQAESRGWNFRSETVVFILVDQGSGNRPSTIYISVPDSHTTPGDLDLLINSIKAQ